MLEQRGNQVCRTHEPLFAGQDGRDFPMWSECQITKNAHEDISQNLRGLIDLGTNWPRVGFPECRGQAGIQERERGHLSSRFGRSVPPSVSLQVLSFSFSR